jgi:hypothetical protein
MLTQLLDSFRKMSESSLQTGQEVFKHWVQHAQPQSLGAKSSPAEWTEAFQKRWTESTAEALNKHRELLDASYKSGIEVIEQSFRLGDARSLEDQRRLVEELWRKLSDAFKSQSEAQLREFQSAAAGWLDLARNGATPHAAKPEQAQAAR